MSSSWMDRHIGKWLLIWSKVFDNTGFVKLRPWEPALCKLVAHNVVDLPKGSRPSLAQCEGFQALMKLRNETTPEFKDVEPDSETASKLFGNGSSQKAQKTKPPRMNAIKLQEMRESPELIEVPVPGVGEGPALNITFIKPPHPCDEMYISMDPDSLEHAIAYIRAGGITVDALTTKRSYGGSESGLWKNGSAGLIQKLAHDDGGCGDDGAMRKKYRSHNKQAELSLAIEDA